MTHCQIFRGSANIFAERIVKLNFRGPFVEAARVSRSLQYDPPAVNKLISTLILFTRKILSFFLYLSIHN